jgi:hypothetical protein
LTKWRPNLSSNMTPKSDFFLLGAKVKKMHAY